MSKVTKWQIQTAEQSMKEAICKKMAKFDKEHPSKNVEPTRSALASIAVKDPKWQAYVVRMANAHNSNIYITTDELVSHSPEAKHAFDNAEKADAPRLSMRSEFENAWDEKKDEIIRRAIIGDMDNANLLKEVTAFCK